MDFNLLNKFDFVFVTKPELKTYVNTSGEFKKDPSNYAVRRNVINKDNMFHYQKEGDKLGLIFTGKTSGITVLDIDSKKIYQKLIKKYPDLNQVFTVETYNGYHMYFSYDSDIRGTITDVFNKYNDIGAVDIRNDGDIITAPGTSYIVESGEVFTYKYLGGELYKVPKQIKKLIKPEYFHSFKPVINEKIMEEVDKELDNNNFNINFHREQMELADEKYKLNYSDWVNFSFMCKNEDDSIDGDYFKLWLDYSNCESYKLSYDDRVKQWQSFKITSNNKITFKSLSYELKMTKPSEYNQLIKKYMKTKKNDNYYMSACIFQKGMRELCISISEELFKNVRYCLDNWYIFDNKSGLWSNIKNPSSKFIETFNKYFNYNISRISKELMNDSIDEEKKKTLMSDRSLFMNACTKYDTCGNHAVMKTHFSDLLVDNQFFEKLDILTDCIAFENGIYNLKFGSFRSGIFADDYLTCKLNFEYNEPSLEAYKKVENIILEICSMEDWRFKYYKSILGYCMTGRANEQQVFYSMTGSGSNGKSFIFEKLSSIFPQYVFKIANDTFERESKNYNKNISSVVGKRIIWCNEPSKNKPYDGEKLKDFSDGTSMNVPFLYQQKPVNIKNNAKLFLIANHNPKFSSDGGIDRRLRAINFASTFYLPNGKGSQQFPANPNPKRDFLVDPTIDIFLNSIDGKLALFKFIAEGAQMYFNNGIIIPDEYLELANEVSQSNNQFLEFINENLEIINNGCIHKDELLELWKKEKNNSCNFDELKSELIRRNFIWDYKKQKKINGKVKTGCFTNMKIVDDEPSKNDLDV